MFYLDQKIRMRLNSEEPLAKDLLDALSDLTPGSEQDDDAHTDALIYVTLAANNFLRNEWRRLKRDIREAQLLQEGED